MADTDTKEPTKVTAPTEVPAAAPLARGTDPPEDAGAETERPAGASKLSADKIEETYGISDAEYAVLLKTVCKDAPREIAAFFMMFCKRRRLDPFTKQVYLWPDKTDKETGKPEPGCSWNIVTGIDGFRSIASRNKLYRGQSRPKWTYWRDSDDNIMEFTKEESKYGNIAGKNRTESCEVSAFRALEEAPTNKELYLEFVGIALFDEFAKRSFGKIQGNWEQQPDHQLRTRSEVMALRMGFPEDVGSLYLEDELKDRQQDTPTRGITFDNLDDAEERTVVDDEIEAAAKELGITVADLHLRRRNYATKLALLEHLNAEVEKKNNTRRNQRDIGAPDEEALDAEHRDVTETPPAPEPPPAAPLVQGKKKCELCGMKPGEPHAENCPAPIGDDGSEGKLPL